MPGFRGLRFIATMMLIGAGGLGACASVQETAPPAREPRATPVPRPANRVPGQYIVTVQEGTDDTRVRAVYVSYGVREITRLGQNQFLLKVRQDPGPDEIERVGLQSDARITAVQPNFIYRINPPAPGSLKRDAY